MGRVKLGQPEPESNLSAHSTHRDQSVRGIVITQSTPS